jgi:chemotaxis protein CheD
MSIGSGDDVLRATLGSCVGIGLLWRERAIYGLAHCLLPEAPDRSRQSSPPNALNVPNVPNVHNVLNAAGQPNPPAPTERIGAKYVTQAIPSLLSLMQVQRASYGELEAVVAGGANMVHYVRRPSHAPIGEQNVRTAQRLLDALGVRIVHTDVGGESGRQLLIDCRQHTFVVKKIARPL